MQEIKVLDHINEAQLHNKDSVLMILLKFLPLLKKYGKKLDEDGESDLTLFLIELIYKLPNINNEGKIVNYIKNSVKNHFYKLYSKRKEVFEYEVSTMNEDLENICFIESIDENINDYIGIEHLFCDLTPLQKSIVIQKYILDYKEIVIAKNLNTSKQAVTNAKKRALLNLKNI